MQARITFLTDIVTPYIVAVLSSLMERAELAVIFCSWTGTRGADWRLDEDLPFAHEILAGLTIRRRRADATDYYLTPQILAALRRSHPDAIISAGFSVPTLYAAAYALPRCVPLLIYSDGTSRSEAALSWPQLFARQVIRRVAWGAIAKSEPAAARFEEIGFAPSRIFRAPHSTEIEPLLRVGRERYNGTRRRPHRQPVRLLWVGRLIPRKGGEPLFRATARARELGADVELHVGGTGPEEARLRSLAEELRLPVTWYGFVDQPELPRLYASADAFAFPTLDDPFGLVLLEAAASGLPVIASSHAGATEDVIRDGVNGIIVDPLDTERMASAILELAQDPQLRERLGRAAHAATRSRTPEATATGYLQAIEAALGHRRS